VFTAKSPVVASEMSRFEPDAGVRVSAPDAVMIDGVDIDVVNEGDVENTASPVPVSSEREFRSWADVIDEVRVP